MTIEPIVGRDDGNSLDAVRHGSASTKIDPMERRSPDLAPAPMLALIATLAIQALVSMTVLTPPVLSGAPENLRTPPNTRRLPSGLKASEPAS